MRWQDMPKGKEKYNAYLCSREWNEKKEAVHRRAGGKCERCLVNPIDAVHHKTYLRQYDEPLEDLEAHCNGCHDFTHGKSNDDPQEWVVAPSLYSSHDYSVLLCPVCQFNCTHCVKMAIQDGIPVLKFIGECGHRFFLAAKQYKGETHLFVGGCANATDAELAEMYAGVHL